MALALSVGLSGSIQCNGGVMADVKAKDLRHGSFFVNTAMLTAITELSLVMLYTFVGLAKLNSLGRTAVKNEDGSVVVRNLNWWAVEAVVHVVLLVLTGFSILLFSLGINEGKKNERSMNVRGEPCDLKCSGYVAAVVLATGCLIPLCMLLKDAYVELVSMDIVAGCWGCRAKERRLLRNHDGADDDGNGMSTEMLKYAGSDGEDADDTDGAVGATPSPKKKQQPAGPSSKPVGLNAASETTYKNDLFNADNA